MRFLFIYGYISFLFRCEEFTVLVKTCHQVADGLFYSSALQLFLRKAESCLMSHTNQSLTILRYTIVNCVHYTIFYNVAKFTKF